MDFYSVLVFLHVLGGVGLFAGLGIEVVALRRLQGAVTLDQARTWLGVLRERGKPSTEFRSSSSRGPWTVSRG
jgi:hypothetical protein